MKQKAITIILTLIAILAPLLIKPCSDDVLDYNIFKLVVTKGDLDKLINRIKNNNIKEVILAVKPSIEGETTSLYISKLLKDTDVVVSKIAHGIPLGTEIDYVDSLTLELAMDNRKKIEDE